MAKSKKEEEPKLNGYSLTHEWFEFVLENPDKVSGNHTALYLWLVRINNRCQWREMFQVTVRELMEGMACKSRTTYSKCFKDLINWGFVDLRVKSENQHQCNVISLYKKCAITGTTTGATSSTITGTITGTIPKQLKPKNNKTPPALKPEIELPFSTEKFKAVWMEWKQYKKDTFKFTYKGKVSEKKALERLEKDSDGNEQLAIEMIDNAIARGWQGIYEINKSGKQAPTSTKAQNQNLTKIINGNEVNLERLSINERKSLLADGLLTKDEYELLNR